MSDAHGLQLRKRGGPHDNYDTCVCGWRGRNIEEHMREIKRGKAHGRDLSPDEAAEVNRMIFGSCENCGEPLYGGNPCIRCGSHGVKVGGTP